MLTTSLVSAAGRADPRGPQWAPVFGPVVPELKTARIPAYLPAYLPPFQRAVYPSVTFLSNKHAYEVDLSYVPGQVSTAPLVFHETAGMGPLLPGPHARHIFLGHGIVGYIGSVPGTAPNSLSVRWRIGGVVYAVGRSGTAIQLIRIAQSMVRVR
jgi:hypothetical protein